MSLDWERGRSTVRIKCTLGWQRHEGQNNHRSDRTGSFLRLDSSIP
jgi:hypothetical protein